MHMTWTQLTALAEQSVGVWAYEGRANTLVRDSPTNRQKERGRVGERGNESKTDTLLRVHKLETRPPIAEGRIACKFAVRSGWVWPASKLICIQLSTEYRVQSRMYKVCRLKRSRRNKDSKGKQPWKRRNNNNENAQNAPYNDNKLPIWHRRWWDS